MEAVGEDPPLGADGAKTGMNRKHLPCPHGAFTELEEELDLSHHSANILPGPQGCQTKGLNLVQEASTIVRHDVPLFLKLA